MKSISTAPVSMLVLRWMKTQIAGWQAAQVKASPEFLAWRSRFLFDRVRLFGWTILAVLVLAGSMTVLVVIPSLTAAGAAVNVERVWRDAQDIGIYMVGLLIGLVLCQRPRWRQHPESLFLLLSWLILLPSHVHAIERGEAQFDSGTWLLVFAMQAILVPVQWRLHVLSQVLVFACVSLELLFGLRDSDLTLAAQYISGTFLVGLICVVADVGVFLYEHSLRREFELRQQLQVFLHAVSHDLRNPVLAMVMTLKSFFNSSEKEAQIPQELLEQLVASGDRQVALINSLLEAHAAELQGIILYRQPVRLSELVDAVVQDFQPFFQQVKTSVRQTISSDLPSVHADPLQLRRVYENLISNALKYNRPGLQLTFTAEVIEHKIQKRIHFNSNLKSQTSKLCWVHCTVRDNGVGMTQQQSDRLFDLYSRGRDQRRSLSLGLGLYMCRQIITAHGGEIGVTSSPNQGATFRFTLPMYDHSS
jgi:signal transduction histidine kinase